MTLALCQTCMSGSLRLAREYLSCHLPQTCASHFNNLSVKHFMQVGTWEQAYAAAEFSMLLFPTLQWKNLRFGEMS